jgi:hypothetical protein
MLYADCYFLWLWGSSCSALERELLGAVGVHGAPVGLVRGLAVVAGGVRLPGLVKGLEVEGVDTPVESAATEDDVLVDAFEGVTYTAS